MTTKTLVFSALLFMANTGYAQTNQANSPKTSKGYANVNGLKMYYETHGQGQPLLLLHGAYMTIEGPFRELIQQYASHYTVIVPEMQGHGRTADIQRDITYEAMADDMDALLKFLKIDSVDVLGYSMGSGVALQLAIRHPMDVKKMVVISGSYSSDGLQPAFIPMVPQIKPEMFNGSPFKMQYDSLAPKPANFPILVEKLKKLDMKTFNWETDYVRIKKPILFIFGDADIVTIDHIRDMFKKQGGNVAGDMVPMPPVQLAILPGTSHLGMMFKLSTLQEMVATFLGSRNP